MVQLLVLVVVAVALVSVISAVIAAVTGFFGIVLQVLFWMFIGYLAGQVLRGKGYGVFGDVGLGLAGGIVGSVLLWITGISIGGGAIGGIIAGVLGAIVLVMGVRLVHDANFAR